MIAIDKSFQVDESEEIQRIFCWSFAHSLNVPSSPTGWILEKSLVYLTHVKFSYTWGKRIASSIGSPNDFSHLELESMTINVNVHTVSLARASGSSKPLGCLYKSASQQFTTTAQKCFNPSRHCTMIFSRNQNTPYLCARKTLIFNYEQSNWQKPYTGNKLKQTINIFPVQQIQVIIVSGEETRGIPNITIRFKLIHSSFRFTCYNNFSMLERARTPRNGNSACSN